MNLDQLRQQIVQLPLELEGDCIMDGEGNTLAKVASGWSDDAAHAMFLTHAANNFLETHDLLQVLLPMAKGYAKAHPVGNNLKMIQEAEAQLKKGANVR